MEIKIGDRPVMFAYALLARCRHLVLTGIDEDGEMEWTGTHQQWNEVSKDEMKAIWV